MRSKGKKLYVLLCAGFVCFYFYFFQDNLKQTEVPNTALSRPTIIPTQDRMFKVVDKQGVRKTFKDYCTARGKFHQQTPLIQNSVVNNTSFFSVIKRNKLALESRKNPLDFVPPVPEKTRTDVVPYFRPEILDHYLLLPNKTYEDRIAILTPIRNADRVLRNYLDNLINLDYPHSLISVYFGEDGSSDNTFTTAAKLSKELTDIYEFRAASVFHFNISHNVSVQETQLLSRHVLRKQLERRSKMAKSRNLLVNMVLNISNPDYVIWIDADLECFPSDLIEQLLFARSDVTAPPCLGVYGGVKKMYDRNCWRETPASVESQSKLPEESLVVEGYSNSDRIYLADLKAEGRVVPLDGVGGCVLMVRAECHRKGLVFPEELFQRHIETEGLAKLAKQMGYSVNGLPWLEVFHGKT
ncbi:uncharacterized protein LOC128222768 [Mya arenaria]|uniref:uncharacterized protein LOC128222768 n=1 Tax=Mya arenaria TaxID=6604 RepID=UPI0022E2060F|nr:uncharacterized protein LOC128222768 [Mya arenaria]XP_052787842.1 uncharacterized protein LOC128222768 [Mya arenaria]XP_052787844.1 uncharacterized protein LOC128222768 [Mya arenaria]XP_052787845.1 uncharacterized protein LOC128222768 [Mya arenaria]